MNLSLSLRYYPDPILRRSALPIAKITPKITKLVDDMVHMMYRSPHTIGLAAPQVGYSLRLIVIDVTIKQKQHGLIVLINPVMVSGEGEKIIREGCLSLPDYTANVKRFQNVSVEGLNRTGEKVRIETNGIEAICLQHEIDHVDGILFLDRVESMKTDIFRRKKYSS